MNPKGSSTSLSPKRLSKIDSPSRKSSPTPYLTTRQSLKYTLEPAPIVIPDSKDMKGERVQLGLSPEPIPKPIKDRFYASVVDANCRDLLSILRDYDCRDLVNEHEDHMTHTDGWRIKSYTPSHYACKYGNSDVLQLLITKGGSDVDRHADFGVTPLMVAAEEGNAECIRIILDSAPASLDINKGDVSNRSAFWLAAHNGHVDCLELLLTHGSCIHARDQHGKSAIHAAAHHQDNNDALRFLCALPGVDINVPDRQGRTPLDTALNSIAIQILQAAGAKPTANDKQADEIRWHAWNRDNDGLLSILAEYECRGIVNDPDSSWEDWRKVGYTAIQYAAASDNAVGVSLLLEHGADGDATGDDEANSALLVACMNGSIAVVQELIKDKHASRVNINYANKSGQNAVFCCSNLNRKAALELLLQKRERVQINRPAYDGLTPLHAACKNHYELCVKMLIAANAVVNPRDDYGYTPLSYTTQDSIKKLLRINGGL